MSLRAGDGLSIRFGAAWLAVQRRRDRERPVFSAERSLRMAVADALGASCRSRPNVGNGCWTA